MKRYGSCPDPWSGRGAYCTTGQFAQAGNRRYLRHCGPTAAANAVLTLRRGQGRSEAAPEKVFLKCAAIGRHSLIYYNIDLLHRFGGTSDLLAGIMLQRCLRACGCRARVGVRRLLTAGNLLRALQRGSFAYLELRRHPVYRNHHLLCYGARREDGRLYLRCADGWKDRMTEIPAGSIRLGWMFEIRPVS